MTAYTTLKTAVLPPTPSAIVSRAVAVTIGVREEQTEGVANVLHQHVELLLGRSPKEIGEKREPEPQGAFVPGAIAVETGHLRPVLLLELTRIQPQQALVEAGAKGVASHTWPGYARLGVRPTARACRSNTVSRSASACAMSRPDCVIR